MPKPLREDFRIFLRYEQQRRATVAQSIKSNLRQFSLYKNRTIVTIGQIWDRQRRSLFTAKDQIEGLPDRAEL